MLSQEKLTRRAGAAPPPPMRCPACGQLLEQPGLICRSCDAELVTGLNRLALVRKRNRRKLIDLAVFAALCLTVYAVYRLFLREYILSLL